MESTKDLRVLKTPYIYTHFKHDPTGSLNNYVYATMFVSKPIDSFMEAGQEVILASYTEDCVVIRALEGKNGFNHSRAQYDGELVFYKSLYGVEPLPYARPLDMFTGKVDRVKYPNSTQVYRFEPLALESASLGVRK